MNGRAISPRPAAAPAQAGVVLFTALVMIVLLTLVVISSLSLSRSSIDLARNLAESHAAKAAAQAAIESVITTPAFVRNPQAVSAAPVSVDVNGDGSADFSVALRAECVSVRAVPNTELDDLQVADRACKHEDGLTNPGIIVATGSVTNPSDCSDTRWNIESIATKSSSGARAVLNQGVAVRIPRDNAKTFCG